MSTNDAGGDSTREMTFDSTSGDLPVDALQVSVDPRDEAEPPEPRTGIIHSSTSEDGEQFEPGSLETAAYHEAGHAVAGLLLNRPFKHATIVQQDGDGNLGQVQPQNWPGGFVPDIDLYPFLRLQLEAAAVCALAGVAAERRLHGPDSTTAKELHDHSERDRQLAITYAAPLAGYGAVQEAYLSWLVLRAQSLWAISFNWLQVEAVAAALLDRKKLTFLEVRTIATGAVAAARAEQR